LKAFYRALILWAEAWKFANLHKLWRFLWIPFFATFAAAILLGMGLYKLHDVMMSWIWNKLEVWDLWPWVFTVLWWSALLAFGFLSLVFFRYVVLVISFPFMSKVSHQVEKILKGENANSQNEKFSVTSMLKDWSRGIAVSIMLFIKEMGWIILFTVLSLIPGMALVTGPIIFGFQSFFAGASNMDYTLERYKGISESWRFMKTHSGAAIGNGIVFLLILAIPIVGLLIAPLLATISSTLHTIELLNKETHYQSKTTTTS
jgi:CysZ protein